MIKYFVSDFKEKSKRIQRLFAEIFFVSKVTTKDQIREESVLIRNEEPFDSYLSYPFLAVIY